MSAAPVKVSPLLLQHIAFIQSQLQSYREACETCLNDCSLHDSTPSGQFDPVHLRCEVCETEMVLFKGNEE